MLCKKTSFMGLLVFFIVSIFLQKVLGENIYPDTLWVPVIFYDYWVDANGTNTDFETGSNGLITGMVYDTLDNQKKPVPTSIACPTPPTSAPAACHLNEWFRVSGAGSSDNSCAFVCDSVTNPKMKRWHWTTSTGGQLALYQNRPGEYIGPNYDATYNMRNIVIYDSLPFVHLGKTNPALLGVYEINNPSFFPLDGRGFGIQPSGQNHNFGFVMELHTTFAYRSGLNFAFTSDDDAWVFINGRKVVDLGGRHAPLTSSINLDTLTGLVTGQNCTLDFLKAERHTSGSNIRITTTIIMAQQPTPVLSNGFPRQDKLLFNASTRTLHYTLSTRAYVSLKYFDISGRMVASFVNQLQNPGSYNLSSPDATLKRGAYIQMFSAGRSIEKDLVVVVR